MTGGPEPLGPASELARRVMLRTGAGPLRPLWRLAYRAVAQGVSAYLRAGDPTASVYSIGSLAGPDLVYGDSDVDLAVVVSGGGRLGAAREAMMRRWERACRVAPQLKQLVFVAVYEDHELERAVARSPFLTRDRPSVASGPPGVALFEPRPFSDPANVASRPILEPPATSWHRLAGRRMLRSSTLESDAGERGRIAWLELQHWWRYAFGACIAPGPRAPYLCVKLASEPARVWLWLVHRERLSSRSETLRRAIDALPEERDAFGRALALQAELPRSPAPPLAEMLEVFLRLTVRIARRLSEEVEAAGVADVRLSWRDEDELVLGLRAGDSLRALLGSRLRLLPLADRRALVWPAPPDEALAEVPGNPADPATLGAAAAAGAAGPYPVLRRDGLLVLPTPARPRTLLRAVQSPVTDPVPFAVLDGERVARFPRAPGWSIEEATSRAVAEHRAWLAAGGATGEASVETLGLLFGAARAGLLLETLDSGEAELALSAAATARSLADSGRMSRARSASSYEAYLASRSGDGPPPTSVVADLRRCVLALPAYRGAAEAVASPA